MQTPEEPLLKTQCEQEPAKPVTVGRVITVALDMTEQSRDAFAWTVANMYREGDKLILINVAPMPIMATMAVPHNLLDEKQKSEVHKVLTKYGRYCKANNIDFEARHWVGDFSVVLDELTKKTGSCALVVGNHKKTPTEHLFVGSHSESTVHGSHVPVVIVKRPHLMTLDPDSSRKIGICVDSSDAALTAFKWAIKDLHREGDSVFILHMSSSPQKASAVLTDTDTAEFGNDVMDMYSNMCMEKKIDYHIVVHSRTNVPLSKSMANLADFMSLDLLVVGSRGRGVVKRKLFGSFSDGLMRECKCNVIVVKDQ